MKEAEFEGRSEEEALLKASQEMGVNIADMTWEVVAHESGLFGLFGRQVRIRVRVSDTAAQLVYRKEFVPGPGDTGLRRSMGGEAAESGADSADVEGRQVARSSQAASDSGSVDAGGQGVKAAQAKEVLLGLLQRLEIGMEVAVRETADEIQLNISGAEAEELVSRDGELLSALQFLVNKIVNRFPEDRKLVVLDTDGFRNRREEVLGDLARRMGEKAVATRKVVRLRPMSAPDRRLVHMALKEVPGLATRSEGEGAFRCLLIIPDGFDRR
jgi:spoIIIJ-associated protein